MSALSVFRRRHAGAHGDGVLNEAVPPASPRSTAPDAPMTERHGIASLATFASLVAQAQAETRAAIPAEAQPEPRPARDMATLTRVRDLLSDPDWQPRWRAPVPAGESAALVARIAYPPADGTREQYAAVMCQVSAATGTSSPYEQPGAWGSARPGVPSEKVMVWTPQRSPMLALEPATEAAS